MKKLIYFIGCLSAALTSNSQETDFTSIQVKNSGKIQFSNGACGYQSTEQLDNKEASVKNGVLHINTNKDLKVSAPSLSNLSLNGAGNFESSDTLLAKDFTVSVNGAGDVLLNIKAEKITSIISGAGDLKLSGKADKHYSEIVGAGDLKAVGLLTKSSFIHVTGAGDAKINVTDSLSGKVRGAGDLVYIGNPIHLNVESNGVGEVSKAIVAQDGSGDTTQLKLGNYRLFIIDEDDNDTISYGDSESEPDGFKQWSGLELGVNGYLGSTGSLSLPSNTDFMSLDYSRSLYFSLNPFEKDFRLYKEYVKLSTGLGFTFNSYQLSRNVALLPNDSAGVLPITSTTLDYGKNKFNMGYVTVPLLLGFNTNSDREKAFHLSMGVVGGWKFYSNTKQKYRSNNEVFRPKTSSDFNLNPFTLAARVGIGYGNYNLFASYSLTPLFTTSKGPELTPFTVGLKILAF